MKESTFKDTSGSMKVSEDVIYTIAEKAALEVDGVYKLENPLDGLQRSIFRTADPTQRPVKVELEAGVCKVAISIIVYDGYRVNDIAKRVQLNVKQSIQNMTGIAVTQVDVILTDVKFIDGMED